MRAQHLASVVALLIGLASRPGSGQTQARSSLKCTPAIARPDDTLRIEMPKPHGDYLIVNAPGGGQFFIIYPDPDPHMPSLVDSEEFATMATFSAQLDSIRGWSWTVGSDTLELPFRAAGTYQIVVASHWETDQPTGVRRCEIRYRP